MSLEWKFDGSPLVKLSGNGLYTEDDGHCHQLGFHVGLHRRARNQWVKFKPTYFHLVDGGPFDALISEERWLKLPFGKTIPYNNFDQGVPQRLAVDTEILSLRTSTEQYWKRHNLPRRRDRNRLGIWKVPLVLRPPGSTESGVSWPIEALVSPEFPTHVCWLSIQAMRQHGLLVRRHGKTAFFWHEPDWSLEGRPRRWLTPEGGTTASA